MTDRRWWDGRVRRVVAVRAVRTDNGGKRRIERLECGHQYHPVFVHNANATSVRVCNECEVRS